MTRGHVIEVAARRSGIERADGTRWARPGYVVRQHEHFCAMHDHRWRCFADPCIQHEAIPCRARHGMETP